MEEEATRIIEILLATGRPAELLAGKVLGVGLVGVLWLAGRIYANASMRREAGIA